MVVSQADPLSWILWKDCTSLKGICLTDNHTIWSSAAIPMCTIFCIVFAPHVHRCIDYYSLINFLWHHIILGHIYDVTMFQTIVMSQIGLCDVIMSIVCCCHDTVVDILPSPTITKSSWQHNGRSLPCGDLHCSIP